MRGGSDGRGKGVMAEREGMAEASSATTNCMDSAPRVLMRKNLNCTTPYMSHGVSSENLWYTAACIDTVLLSCLLLHTNIIIMAAL